MSTTLCSEFRYTDCSTVFEYGLLVLNTHNSDLKASLSLECKRLYDNGKIELGNPKQIALPPTIAARPLNIKILPPSQLPKRKKGGSLKNRIALIHSFCHIESYAIDLSWDILLRYSSPNNYKQKYSKKLTSEKINQIIQCFENNNFKIFENNSNDDEKHINKHVILPKDFYVDWLRIAAEEALHYNLWSRRLKELGSFYGALPGHGGLWLSAKATHNDLLSRLAIVHMVLEGRGLDVAPASMQKLRNAKDEKSLNLLKIIYRDEITHVGSGIKWFKYVCEKRNINDPIKHFQQIVREKFDGNLKPPFNHQARAQAGFTKEWYLPLAT